MTEEEIYERIVRIVSDQLGVDPSEVLPQANFVNDLGADSLEIVELVMAVEEEFHIKISDETSEEIATVQAVVDYIKAASKQEVRDDGDKSFESFLLQSGVETFQNFLG